MATGATTASETTARVLDTVGMAAGLAGAAGTALKELSSIGSVFKKVPEIKFPMINPLHFYATYDYILSIGVLTVDELNNPDSTYMAGKQIPLVCKSANTAPDNRIETTYGKFDFFIDNLVIHSNMGHEQNNNTNVTMISFDIREPYSMGLFAVACQTAAANAGWQNWREAAFLLTIEFKGNVENGAMFAIPGTTRHIPFKWGQMSMRVTHEGGMYNCEVVPHNQDALATRNVNLKNDTSISGTTVQEVLQTGEKSLQAVINKRLMQLKTDNLVPEPDEVIILFPTNVSSDPSQTPTADVKESKSGATTRTVDTANANVLTKLGLSRSEKNQTLIQQESQCNALGKAKVKGDTPFGKDNTVWDANKEIYVRTNNTPNSAEGEFRFRQDTDIINAINQVLIQSEYPTTALDPSQITKEGYRQWWKIDVQSYVVSTDANLTATGTKPRLHVYRVIPYMVHASSGPLPPNTKVPGNDELYKQAVKRYEYIYTGHNVDILNFEIKYSNTFSAMMSADGGKYSMDVKNAAQSGKEYTNNVNTVQMKGNAPEKGVTPTQIHYAATSSTTDKLGGGGTETAATRAARIFHETINNTQQDMTQLELTILGDPYYIAQSGTGNYTSVPTQYANLNTDGTVNFQSGEVHIFVMFRTPIDIDQKTGMYDFGGQTKTTPVMQYSGCYRVNKAISTFKDGKFTQVIEGHRVILQEATVTATNDQLFGTSSLSRLLENGEVSHFLGPIKDVAADVNKAVVKVEKLGENLLNAGASIVGSAVNAAGKVANEVGNIAGKMIK